MEKKDVIEMKKPWTWRGALGRESVHVGLLLDHPKQVLIGSVDRLAPPQHHCTSTSHSLGALLLHIPRQCLPSASHHFVTIVPPKVAGRIGSHDCAWWISVHFAEDFAPITCSDQPLK